MDIATKATEESFVVAILVAVWLVLVIAVAICNKAVHIHKCVMEIKESRRKYAQERAEEENKTA